MKSKSSNDSHNNGLNLLVCNTLFGIESHLMWVCGLKRKVGRPKKDTSIVTPHVGVWIETSVISSFRTEEGVTPHVGVWIETWNLE